MRHLEGGTVSTEDIRNYLKVDDTLITGGQPTEDQLRSAASEGFQDVVNLATDDPRYSLENERDLVQDLGMDYHHIPVVWASPQTDDLLKFETCMKGLAGRKVLLHCAANYRVTAFYALYAVRNLGWTREQAEDFIESMWQPERHEAWGKFVGRHLEEG